MSNLEEITSYLKNKGFRRVSLEGPNKQTYISSDYSVSITVEEHKDKLTPEDEERIKNRLRELGYL